MLTLEPVAADDSAACARALADTIPSAGLVQVQFVAVDNTSAKYYSELKAICPNLQGMCLDPTHLAMTVEYASRRKRTALSKTLRSLLAKLSARDDTCSAATWGVIYKGGQCQDLTLEEARLRNQIEDSTMRLPAAQKVLQAIDATVPFYLRIDWIRSLAALSSVYSSEVQRIAPGPNKRVVQLLHTAAAPARTEWYFNNTRIRHLLQVSRLSLLPIGTTSNEALRREINVWFRETQKLLQATLKLKLRILRLAKNLSHNAALYRPTTRQMPQAEVVARVSSRALFSNGEWREWCVELACPNGRVH